MTVERRLDPRFVAEQGEAQAFMAAAGQGVVLAPRSLSNLRIDGIAYRPVEGYSGAVELALAWRGEESPAIQAILRGLTRGGDD